MVNAPVAVIEAIPSIPYGAPLPKVLSFAAL
jgi:hypothetical protein